MKEIIPAIMPKNFEDMRDKVSMVVGIVPLVQVDLCDGIFVGRTTWPFHTNDEQSLDDILNEREGMPYWQEINFELDLMVNHAMENFENYVRMGPKRIIFHIEAETDLEAFREFLEGIDLYTRENIEMGVAINIDSDPALLMPISSHIDFIQCMGIAEIGKQGEPFDERVIEKIKMFKEKYVELPISVDGGVSLHNAPALLKAGVDRLVVGSAIYGNDDIIGTIESFKDLIDQYAN